MKTHQVPEFLNFSRILTPTSDLYYIKQRQLVVLSRRFTRSIEADTKPTLCFLSFLQGWTTSGTGLSLFLKLPEKLWSLFSGLSTTSLTDIRINDRVGNCSPAFRAL